MELNQILLVLLALVAANVPFVGERIFFVINPKSGNKHLAWRLLELIVLFFIVGFAAYLLEAKLATPHNQSWEFYAITGCLFLVFAYPGFVARYLWKKRGS